MRNRCTKLHKHGEKCTNPFSSYKNIYTIRREIKKIDEIVKKSLLIMLKHLSQPCFNLKKMNLIRLKLIIKNLKVLL